MSYEDRFLWEKGDRGPEGDRGPTGPTGVIGEPGKNGSPTPQPKIELIETETIAQNLTVTDAINGGSVVGSGRAITAGTKSYVSLSLPTNEPPTVDNNGKIAVYYAKTSPSVTSLTGGTRITDDGLAAYSLNTINRSGQAYLQIRFLGGSGNGVINTILD